MPVSYSSKVEGEAQGTPSSIEKLLTDLNRGPSLAKVCRLDKQDIAVKEGEDGFEVRR